MAKKIKVSLKPELIRGNLGFVDRESGVMISAAKYPKGKKYLEVPRTGFVEALISGGDLVEVKAQGQRANDTQGEGTGQEKPEQK